MQGTLSHAVFRAVAPESYGQGRLTPPPGAPRAGPLGAPLPHRATADNSPEPPPATAALTGLAPCAQGGLEILPVLGLRRTARRIELGPGGFLYNCLLNPSSREAALRGIRCGVPGCPTRRVHTAGGAGPLIVLPHRYGNRGRAGTRPSVLASLERDPGPGRRGAILTWVLACPRASTVRTYVSCCGRVDLHTVPVGK